MSNNNNNEVIEQPIDIELSEEIAEGIYSNLAIITHSQAEFIIDFVRILPGVPKGKVKSRIIMTPQHAKRLLYALGDNMQKFESNFGEVDIENTGSGNTFPINFGGMTGQA
ncbi:MAG: DUF3467 domain-containing protein [Bacteroidetes bacterium]|nr:DUF3467 domain-containing protein [Bacteroidota bacterium]